LHPKQVLYQAEPRAESLLKENGFNRLTPVNTGKTTIQPPVTIVNLIQSESSAVKVIRGKFGENPQTQIKPTSGFSTSNEVKKIEIILCGGVDGHALAGKSHVGECTQYLVGIKPGPHFNVTSRIPRALGGRSLGEIRSSIQLPDRREYNRVALLIGTDLKGGVTKPGNKVVRRPGQGTSFIRNYCNQKLEVNAPLFSLQKVAPLGGNRHLDSGEPAGSRSGTFFTIRSLVQDLSNSEAGYGKNTHS
jgi:hypothetical protein